MNSAVQATRSKVADEDPAGKGNEEGSRIPGLLRSPSGKFMSTEAEKEIKETVRDFILRSIAISGLDDDDNLFESGIVNSLFAVQLMTFIEKSFAIEVGVDDLDIENFKSLNATTAFVLKKNGWRNG
jgi:methoxymalonate biosynthesis acyl carrier protein